MLRLAIIGFLASLALGQQSPPSNIDQQLQNFGAYGNLGDNAQSGASVVNDNNYGPTSFAGGLPAGAPNSFPSSDYTMGSGPISGRPDWNQPGGTPFTTLPAQIPPNWSQGGGSGGSGGWTTLPMPLNPGGSGSWGNPGMGMGMGGGCGGMSFQCPPQRSCVPRRPTPRIPCPAPIVCPQSPCQQMPGSRCRRLQRPCQAARPPMYPPMPMPMPRPPMPMPLPMPMPMPRPQPCQASCQRPCSQGQGSCCC